MSAPVVGSGATLLARGERRLRQIVETVASAILVTEVLLLLVGVLFRYVLRTPAIWCDELASILFIWLGMLGAVSALLRGQHMRLTIFVNTAPRRTAEFLDLLAAVVPVATLFALLAPAIRYAIEEIPVTTPALEWSNAVRASALPVGIALMAAVALFRLIASGRSRLFLGLGMCAAATLLLWAAGPLVAASGNFGAILFFVVFLLASVMAGIPIAFAFAVVTISYLLSVDHAPLEVVISRMDEGMSGIILLAVPLFILLGALIEITGIAAAMVNFLVALLGHFRCGLNAVLLGAMYLVSGISGAKAADMAAVAPVLFPEMKRRGAEEGEMLSLLAASAAMSEVIPPSIVLIAIGSVAGVSIAQLFIAGLLPAGLLALALGAIAWWRSPVRGAEGQERFSSQRLLSSLLPAVPALALPILIRMAVTEGIATATEVSTLAIVYSLVVGLVLYKGLSWRRIDKALRDAVALSGMILLIVGAASAMGWALTTSGFARELGSLMSNLPGGKAGFLLGSILVFMVLGSILEGIPAMVLLGPLLFPVAKLLGVNEVHYAIVAVLAMGIGLFSPPFGVGYYSACAIGQIDPDRGMRKIWPYMAVLVAGTLLIAFVPWISTAFLR